MRTETVDFKRDRWGRPLIEVEGLMKPLPYTRPSSLGKVLTDDTALSKWAQRMVVFGMANNRNLQLLATTVKNPDQEKSKLTEIVERALDTAGSHDAANYGTGVHACIADMLEGGDYERYPSDVIEYAAAALSLLEDEGYDVELVEQAVVNDELQSAGTFDFLLRHRKTGQHYIGDTKTSKAQALKYSGLSWATQLAVYARAEWLWDQDEQQRHPWGTPPSPEVGIIVHVPSDALDKAKLVYLDLDGGYRAALLSNTVKQARKHKFILPDTSSVPA